MVPLVGRFDLRSDESHRHPGEEYYASDELTGQASHSLTSQWQTPTTTALQMAAIWTHYGKISTGELPIPSLVTDVGIGFVPRISRVSVDARVAAHGCCATKAGDGFHDLASHLVKFECYVKQITDNSLETGPSGNA